LGWLGTWANRVKILVNHNDIDANLSYFPVLINISGSSGINDDDLTAIFDELGANRKKIAITTSDGTTQCYVEIEKWDNLNEEAWLWVNVPSISSDSDSVLYLYYDSNQSDNTSYVGDTGSAQAQGVWDSNFKLVCHMRDATTSTVKDSTSNNADGDKKGSGEPSVTSDGMIADAQSFDGSDDDIEIASGKVSTTGKL